MTAVPDIVVEARRVLRQDTAASAYVYRRLIERLAAEVVRLSNVSEPGVDRSVSGPSGGEFDPALFTRQTQLSREVWPEEVLDRVEEWINAKCGGDADVRTIAAALIANLPSPSPMGFGGPTKTGITCQFTAKHFDPIMDEGLHEHTWAVTAFYPGKPLRDGRALMAGLEQLLAHLPDTDGVLPEALWSAEAIATRVALLTGVVGVRISRPNGLEAWFGSVPGPAR